VSSPLIEQIGIQALWDSGVSRGVRGWTATGDTPEYWRNEVGQVKRWHPTLEGLTPEWKQ